MVKTVLSGSVSPMAQVVQGKISVWSNLFFFLLPFLC